MNVVIIGDFSETARKRIVGQFPAAWQVAVGTAAETEPALAEAEVIIPEHAVVDAPLLDRAPRLRLVQTGAGYDNVAIPECTKRGVYVANAAGVNAVAVAEHVLAFIFCWYRNIVRMDGMLKRGAYGFDYAGAEISGKSLGIVGMGQIGREVARRALALEMKVLGYAVHPVAADDRVQMTDLETLLRLSDVVTLHCSLNRETRHLIGARAFDLMRPGAFLINTARGAIVDEAALIAALRAGKIAGAGLDVFEKEPLPEESLLRRFENVILTPHTAGMPDGFKFHQKRYAYFRENIGRVSRGLAPHNALNRIDRAREAENP
ncbi:MAG: phosphoglycerate dehydrogenase [Deltaproteobacteria bacterium]|nr:phosphoglycerate dehydrogenase [Deltaproteobacteria bacterium]